MVSEHNVISKCEQVIDCTDKNQLKIAEHIQEEYISELQTKSIQLGARIISINDQDWIVELEQITTGVHQGPAYIMSALIKSAIKQSLKIVNCLYVKQTELASRCIQLPVNNMMSITLIGKNLSTIAQQNKHNRLAFNMFVATSRGLSQHTHTIYNCTKILCAYTFYQKVLIQLRTPRVDRVQQR